MTPKTERKLWRFEHVNFVKLKQMFNIQAMIANYRFRNLPISPEVILHVFTLTGDATYIQTMM